VKADVPPTDSTSEVGLTLTEVSGGVDDDVTYISTGALCSVTPFRVTLAKRATVPPLLPAVNVTWF
jgi:hypothetical protein